MLKCRNNNESALNLRQRSSRDAKEKNYFYFCISELPSHNIKNTTLTALRRLVSQKKCNNKRRVATPP